VGDRPFHAHDGVADIRRLPLRDVWVCVHHRNSDVAGESGWERHHLPEVLHEESRRCQRMPDLRASPPAPANGEPLAPLEFGIRHTESATIDGDDSIEGVQMLTARTRWLVVGALIPMSLSAVSCEPLFKAQAERMGVTANEDGVPVIVAVPCPDERVVTMELLDPESVVVGTPTTYWRVRSDQAVDGKTYMLPINNQPPADFDLVVRLAETPPATIALLANVRTLTSERVQSGGAREFRIEDLRVGEVMARGGQLVSFDEFMTSARDAC
jgi:hypothetical protein